MTTDEGVTMSTDDRLNALLERHVRLRRAAQAVIDEGHAVGNAENPEVGVPAHAIRRLRRELDGEPQPSRFAWMSPS